MHGDLPITVTVTQAVNSSLPVPVISSDITSYPNPVKDILRLSLSDVPYSLSIVMLFRSEAVFERDHRTGSRNRCISIISRYLSVEDTKRGQVLLQENYKELRIAVFLLDDRLSDKINLTFARAVHTLPLAR